MNNSKTFSAVAVIASVLISACSSTNGAGINSPSLMNADQSAAAVGAAAIGDTIRLSAGNPTGATSADIISEYFAASNRRCRQVLPRGGETVRIACEHRDGSWHWVRELTNSKVAEPLPALVTVGAVEPIVSISDAVDSLNSGTSIEHSDVVYIDSTSAVDGSSFTSALDDSSSTSALDDSSIVISAGYDQRIDVGLGETLWKFSERTTGSGVHWQAIAELNDIDDARTVTSNMSLLVPAHLAIGQ